MRILRKYVLIKTCVSITKQNAVSSTSFLIISKKKKKSVINEAIGFCSTK